SVAWTPATALCALDHRDDGSRLVTQPRQLDEGRVLATHVSSFCFHAQVETGEFVGRTAVLDLWLGRAVRISPWLALDERTGVGRVLVAQFEVGESERHRLLYQAVLSVAGLIEDLLVGRVAEAQREDAVEPGVGCVVDRDGAPGVDHVRTVAAPASRPAAANVMYLRDEHCFATPVHENGRAADERVDDFTIGSVDVSD